MLIQKTRSASLASEMETFITGRVTSGLYQSASEVAHAALHLLSKNPARGS